MSLEEKIKLRKQGRELAEATYANATHGLHAEALLAFCRNMAAVCEGTRTFTPAQAKAFERTKCVFQPFDDQSVGDMAVQQLAALADSANDIHAYLRSDSGRARLDRSEFKSAKSLTDDESDTEDNEAEDGEIENEEIEVEGDTADA